MITVLLMVELVGAMSLVLAVAAGEVVQRYAGAGARVGTQR